MVYPCRLRSLLPILSSWLLVRMLALIVRHLFEHGGGHVGAQDLALASPIERMVDGARVANHLNVECAADAFPVPLNVDLYLLQRHELEWSPNVPQQSYARSFRRLARGSADVSEGPGFYSETPGYAKVRTSGYPRIVVKRRIVACRRCSYNLRRTSRRFCL